MSANELVYEHPDSIEVISGITAGILSPMLIIITIIHCYNVYQDLFTNQRRSLKVATKPQLNTQHQITTYLTFATIVLYCILLFGFAIQYNFSVHCMKGLNLIEFIAFYGSKCGLYLTYIHRLYIIYGESAYRYKVTRLLCLAVTIAIFSTVLLILCEVVFFTEPLHFEDQDKVFPHFCAVYFPYEDYALAAVVVYLTFVYDLFMSIVAIILFMIPLKRIIKMAKYMRATDGNSAAIDEVDKFKHVGYKYKVIVISASCSTLTWILLYMLTLYELFTIMYLFDLIINPICLLLMTPYYPSIYYEKACFLCVLCCDRKKQSHGEDRRSVATKSRTEPVTLNVSSDAVPSVGTKDAASITSKDEPTATTAVERGSIAPN